MPPTVVQPDMSSAAFFTEAIMIERENRVRTIPGERGTLYRFYNTSGKFTNSTSVFEPGTESYFSKVRQGEDTIGYDKGLYRYRFIPPTAYIYDRVERNSWTGVVYLKQAGLSGTEIQVSGVLTANGSSGVQIPDITKQKASLNAQVTTQLLNRAKDQKINLAQAFAERAQTIQLLASTAIKLAKSFSALRQGNIVAAGKALGVSVSRRTRRNYRMMRQEKPLDAISNAWLELQYGWKPLLSDCYGAAEQAAILNGEKIIGKASTYARMRVCDSDTVGIPDVQGSPIGTVVRTVQLYQKMTVYFEVNNSTLKSAAQMGMTNPLTIAWELTPWSFVVDWFLPVGNWLNSLDATAGTSFKSGISTVTEEHLYEGTITGFGPDTSGYWAKRAGSGKYFYKRFVMTRSPMANWPSSKLPEFKNPFSTVHALNAIALLKGVFSRHKTDLQRSAR